MLKDKFDRIHDYLRISLTDKCNLRCTYCFPAGSQASIAPRSNQMTPEEIENIAGVFVSQGVKKIRLTGGEPLIRKDAVEIIERLSKFPVELTITTNGVFVDEFIGVFRKAGIHSVNVSLDSLSKETNRSITGLDEFDKVRQNIDLLLTNKFHVKVNAVIMKNVNDHEIPDFIEWTRNQPLHVRFIEFMPFSGNHWDKEKVISHREMLEFISHRFAYIKLGDGKNDTAKKYFVPGFKGTFAIISTMSEPFCSGCNRLRLTADGKMKNCLFSRGEADILGTLRSGQDVLPVIRQCIGEKAEALGGQFSSTYDKTDGTKISNRTMIGIGG